LNLNAFFSKIETDEKEALKVMNILLIEDFKSDQETFLKTLSSEKTYEVVVDYAECMEDAILKLRSNVYDVFVSDVNLPDSQDIQGLSVLREFLKSTPGILWIGSENKEDLRDAAIELGFQDHLLKAGLTPELLVRTIDLAVRQFATEKKLRDLDIKLKYSQRLDSLGKLARGIAHDFNNKLAIISLNMQVIRKRLAQNKDISQALGNIDKTVLVSAELSQQLLKFGRERDESEGASLNTVLSESLEVFERTLPPTIQLEQKPYDGEISICADPVQLDQVVMNLCLNAQHAIGKNPGTIKLSIDLIDAEKISHLLQVPYIFQKFVRLKVEDSGVGMSAETQSRIFDPFFTTKSPEKGTGLGLSVVKYIVDQLGGQITVKSVEGAGACFEVYLRALQRERDFDRGAATKVSEG